MNNADEARLAAMCEIFGIPLASTEPNPELALNVLVRMYLVPTIDSYSDRNRALNEIRGQLAGHFDLYSVFVIRTYSIAVEMQDVPHWWSSLNSSTEELVELYQSIQTGKQWLGYMAIGGASTAGGAGSAAVAEGIKTGSMRDAAIKGGRRLIGQGPIVEELVKKGIGRLGAARAGAAGVVVALGATALQAHAAERLEQIEAILINRFHSGDMTDDQYRTVFGTRHDPSNIKKYWEM